MSTADLHVEPDAAPSGAPAGRGRGVSGVAARRLLASVVTVVAAAIGLAAYGLGVGRGERSRVVTAGPQTTATTTVPASVRAALLAAVDREARAEGGHAVHVEVVRSTRVAAVRYTMGDGLTGDTPVWVVQAEGDRVFTCARCHTPAGAKAPTGRVITLVVADPGLGGLDFGLDDTPKDLSQLGPVVRLRG